MLNIYGGGRYLYIDCKHYPLSIESDYNTHVFTLFWLHLFITCHNDKYYIAIKTINQMKIFPLGLFMLVGNFVFCQNLEVDGKMIVKDINTIATFQSTVKNSFIKFATNNDPMRSTNIGYFDDDSDKYFFIDLPQGDFGQFIIDLNGRVAIGTTLPEAAQLTVKSDNFWSIYSSNSRENGNGVRGLTTGAGGAGVFGYSLVPDGIGVEGFAQSAGFDFFASGAGTNYGSESSRRWKSNIRNIDDPLDKLALLRGVYYTWDERHGGQHDIGFIAEEVGEVLSEIVVYEENGVDATGMDYSKMTPLLVEAANAMRKEYQDKFDIQQSELDQLRQEMTEIRAIISSFYSSDKELTGSN